MRLIRWLGWRAADFTAWGYEQRLWPYGVYRSTALLAFRLEYGKDWQSIPGREWAL